MPSREYIVTKPPTPDEFGDRLRVGGTMSIEAVTTLDELSMMRGSFSNPEKFSVRMTDAHADLVRFALGYIGGVMVKFDVTDKRVTFTLDEFDPN